MIAFDPGVRLGSLHPQIAVALVVADQVFTEIGKTTETPEVVHCYVTSCNDKYHSFTSLHYDGAAFDLRTKHLGPGEARLVTQRIRARLMADFDVLLESEGRDNEHIHLEYQPKRPKCRHCGEWAP